jgi:hypothetical protein
MATRTSVVTVEARIIAPRQSAVQVRDCLSLDLPSPDAALQSALRAALAVAAACLLTALMARIASTPPPLYLLKFVATPLP